MTSPPFIRSALTFLSGKAPIEGELLALTPEYHERQHGIYLAAIGAVLRASEGTPLWRSKTWWTRFVHRGGDRASKDARNIALTGGYGVGKSSILKEVARRNRSRVVQVSLSTLGLDDDTEQIVKSATEPAQTNEPSQENHKTKVPATELAQTRTNAIQKEVVKQLLYREKPLKMPGSRYRRIGRFAVWRSFWVSLLVATAMTLVFYLAGWTAQIEPLTESFAPGYWVHAVIFAALTASVFLVLALSHNRLQIRQVKIADTDIALEDGATSYFDQYLDEIVYFFDVTKRDIVIFEDIDRFNDTQIFETLRALNTLLNGAGQLKGRHIRFIYAIKDSIFVKLGELSVKNSGADVGSGLASDVVAVEVERANRTKFFDLVVPVVPFITHRNARNLMDEVLREVKGSISPGLIDLAARHVTDMRLIKNVRNEFVIFKQKVMKSDDGEDLDLDDSSLFAMMLYKSTHLGDFEKIKAGKSELDTLYNQFRSIVELTRRRLTAEAQDVRRQIANLDTADARSREFGDKLLAYAARIRRHLGIADQALTAVSLSGQERTDDDLLASAFWRELAGSEGDLQLSFNDRGMQRGQLTISKADAVEIFGETLSSAENWDDANRAPLQKRLAEIDDDREKLSHGDMNLLMEHDEYVDEDGHSFSELAKGLGSQLAQDLVAGGYLGRDFTLYTSTYYSGRVSTRAQNFLMHNVTRKAMDIHYALTPEDVDAIVKEQGDSVLREHGMYNISVFDHLLAPRASGESDEVFVERDRRANLLVRGMTAYGVDETQILDAYLEGGTQLDSLVRKLAPRWGQIFDFLTKQTELDADVRLRLFNAALASLGSRVSYAVKDNGVREYIEERFLKLPVLTDAAAGAQAADQVVNLLAVAGVQIPSLAELSDDVKSAVIASSAYAITRPNLEAAHGDANIALDQLRGDSEIVYRYALSDLDAYLTALRDANPDAPTVSVPDALAAVVADIASKTPDALPTVLDGAVPEAEVASLTNVPQAAWQALADRSQFPATFSNVTAYITTVGEIDSHLGAFLAESGAINTPEDVTEPDRQVLAAQLVSAATAIPDPAVRVALAKSLELAGQIPIASVPAEIGSLFGMLIESELLSDDAQSFALALAQDWSTREDTIRRSEEFVDYMTPTEVPLSDIPPLMTSSGVSNAVKDVVLARADEFVPTNDRAALTALANHALRGKKPETLPITLVTRMATSGVASDLVVRLLEPLVATIDETQLVTILSGLGGIYADVSARNGKQRKKIPNTPAGAALVNRLDALGIVSTQKVDGKSIKVNMKKSVS